MFKRNNTSAFQLIKNTYIFLYIIISYIQRTSFYGNAFHMTIRTSENGKANPSIISYSKSVVQERIWHECQVHRKKFNSKFSLNTSKRHKEALLSKKYRMTGTSTVARHYAIVGRKGGRKKINKVTMLPHKEIVLPARRCMLLGKMDNRKARKISKSGIKTHRIQRVNLLKKRIYFEKEDRFVKLRLSARGLKTIKKYGLERCAKKFKLNLKNKKIDAGHSTRRKKKKLEPNGKQDPMRVTSSNNYKDVSSIMQQLNIQK